jgi:aspartate aminotransferase
MTGWWIGFDTGPAWLLEAMEKLQGQQTSGACTIAQHAAPAALTGPQDFVRNTRAVFERRRNIVVARLNGIQGLHCAQPAGAFHAFASCEKLIGRRSAGGRLLASDEDVALALLDEPGVGVMQGSAFGLGPYLRIAFALDEALLDAACSAIETSSGSAKRQAASSARSIALDGCLTTAIGGCS